MAKTFVQYKYIFKIYNLPTVQINIKRHINVERILRESTTQRLQNQINHLYSKLPTQNIMNVAVLFCYKIVALFTNQTLKFSFHLYIIIIRTTLWNALERDATFAVDIKRRSKTLASR